MNLMYPGVFASLCAWLYVSPLIADEAKESMSVIPRLADIETQLVAPWTAWAEETKMRDIFWFATAGARLSVKYAFEGGPERVEPCGRLRIDRSQNKVDCAIAITGQNQPTTYEFYRFINNCGDETTCISRATSGAAGWVDYNSCAEAPITWVYAPRTTLRPGGVLLPQVKSVEEALDTIALPFLRVPPPEEPLDLRDAIDVVERTFAAHSSFHALMIDDQFTLNAYTCGEELMNEVSVTADLTTNWSTVAGRTKIGIAELAKHVAQGKDVDLIIPCRDRRSCGSVGHTTPSDDTWNIICKLTIQDTDRLNKPHVEQLTYTLIIRDWSSSRPMSGVSCIQCRDRGAGRVSHSRKTV